MVSSKGEARRLVTQGGVKIDGAKIDSIEHNVDLTNESVVQAGKRKFIKVKKQ